MLREWKHDREQKESSRMDVQVRKVMCHVISSLGSFGNHVKRMQVIGIGRRQRHDDNVSADDTKAMPNRARVLQFFVEDRRA